jgi:hypothetical protein
MPNCALPLHISSGSTPREWAKRSHVFPITMLQHGNQQADFVLEMVYDRRLGQSACFGYLTNGKAPKPVL